MLINIQFGELIFIDLFQMNYIQSTKTLLNISRWSAVRDGVQTGMTNVFLVALKLYFGNWPSDNTVPMDQFLNPCNVSQGALLRFWPKKGASMSFIHQNKHPVSVLNGSSQESSTANKPKWNKNK